MSAGFTFTNNLLVQLSNLYFLFVIRFPNDSNIIQLECWKAFCNISSPDTLVEMLYLCQDHFSESDIMVDSNSGCKQLKPDTVPIQSLLPSNFDDTFLLLNQTS